MRLELAHRRLPLREPLRAAWGEISERELIEVRLGGDQLAPGRGEAAPLTPYDGVELATVEAALEVYGAILGNVEEIPREPEASFAHTAILAACRAERDLPEALAAVDLALYDLRGKRAQLPVARLLAGDRALAAIPVNGLIDAIDRAGAAEAAARLAAEGYSCIKVKVGAGDDAGRLAAVRAAVGAEMVIRIDANGAWATPEEALANLEKLAPIGLELCEEPVHGVEELRAVRDRSPVPIAMDETFAPGSGAADLACLKIARCGGITGLIDAAQQARAAGTEPYIASTLDGPLGIAAGLHAAAALRITRPNGLATATRFDAAAAATLAPWEGEIALPARAGLGIRAA